MTGTSVHSLRDFWSGKVCLTVVLGAILATLANGCGHTNSNEADSARPLFPAPMNAGWGVIDDRGKTVIAPRYEAVQPFSEGLAAAKYEGRWGFINRKGAQVIPFLYRRVESFHGGVAIVDIRDCRKTLSG